MKIRTIAILVPKYPNLVQTYILNQIAFLKSTGMNVIVVARRKGSYYNLPAIIHDKDLLENTLYINTSLGNFVSNLLSLPVFSKRYWQAIIKTVFSGSFSKFGFRYISYKLFCTKVLAYKDIDFIHSHSLFTSFDYLFMRQDLNIPLITTYHGKPPPDVPWLDSQKIEVILETGDLFLVNTVATQNELIEMGCKANKIRVIPQGTDLGRFPFIARKVNPADRITLLSVGRLSVEKGHRIAINALAEIKTDFPAAEYHLVGNGPERNALQNLANHLGLGDRVVFHGFQIDSALLKLYSDAHIFILPSLAETQGTVLQEAQASGIPVIASNTGGIPEVIQDGQTGLLFSAGNALELASKISNLANDSDFYQKLSLAGRKDVEERFDIRVVSRQLFSTYEDILGY